MKAYCSQRDGKHLECTMAKERNYIYPDYMWYAIY